MTITLELPLPPNMSNSRRHWRVVHRDRVAYWNACHVRLLAKLIPPPPANPLSGVVIRPTLYLWAYMDDDNALARIKHGADFLKRAGYIVDDKRPHCRFEIPEQYIDRANQRLVLTIVPASLTPAA